jgi:hypothetical protein
LWSSAWPVCSATGSAHGLTHGSRCAGRISENTNTRVHPLNAPDRQRSRPPAQLGHPPQRPRGQYGRHRAGCCGLLGTVFSTARINAATAPTASPHRGSSARPAQAGRRPARRARRSPRLGATPGARFLEQQLGQRTVGSPTLLVGRELNLNDRRPDERVAECLASRAAQCRRQFQECHRIALRRESSRSRTCRRTTGVAPQAAAWSRSWTHAVSNAPSGATRSTAEADSPCSGTCPACTAPRLPTFEPP